jgi:CHAT domain-containing protein
VRDLEQQLGARSAEVRAQVTPVTVEAVQAALPKDAALVELLAVQPPVLTKAAQNPDPATRRYVAYVLPAKGAPAWVDLGLVGDLDPLVTKLRDALATKRADVRDPAQALGEKVMKPLRPLLGAARHLFLSPDGALNLVPFGALVDDQGQFELQRYTFTYLTSGRDLLRLRAQLPARERATIVADPDFGPAGPAGAVAAADDGVTRGRRSADLRTMSWTRLPGTAEEARTVSALLKEAVVFSGAAATEAALKRVAGPRVLHVATHGFFLQAEEESAAGVPENPLLRSGLLLSGANRLQSGGQDGVLTALEASGLDLGGTKLVVLSACETGLGQVRAGDGVYGLRRALVIAGAESQVMSLWKVDDKVTRDLMVEFYKRLLAGQGRSAALREAQLTIMQRPGTDHPFYWAAFIPAGAWGPMK